MKIDNVEISGRNLLGNSYALHFSLKIYSDLSRTEMGNARSPPEDINLINVDGSIGTCAQSGTLERVFASIMPDFTTLGWGSNSSDVRIGSLMEVKSVAHSKNEDYSFLNLITSPLTGSQVKAIDQKMTNSEIRLFILLNFYFTFDTDKNALFKNSFTLRSNYNTNQFYYAINSQEWSKIKSQMDFSKSSYIEISEMASSSKEVMRYIDLAEKAYNDWDYKGVFNNCREAGSLLNVEVKRALGARSFAFAEKWKRAFANFESFASLALHVEDIRGGKKYTSEEISFTRSDADHMIILTKSLSGFATNLIANEKIGV